MKAKTIKKESVGKIRNNFFENDIKKFKNPSSKQLQEILSMNGLADINFKKQMLLSKIKNSDAAHDKYMKVIEAMSDFNEPDFESAEIGKKTKGKMFTTNPRLTQQQNLEKMSGVMPIAGMYFNNKPSDKVIAKSSKSKVLTSGLNTGKSKSKVLLILYDLAGVEKTRQSYGSSSESRKQYNSLNSRYKNKQKDPMLQKYDMYPAPNFLARYAF
jgi:hypothetical protein